MVVGKHLPVRQIVTSRQVRDAHLIAIARHHGAILATFDRGAVALAGGVDAVLVPTQ
ncbi:MAG TPA: hypothetical protein VG015_07135 [Candidatus Dormibacteraeota bacterium]|jgi:predicted nucleic acid-binding protein|nr:hypothetical protein [Candidatus Dormibacteraeota bacterium]